jgi:hypothetical protein
VSQSDREPPQSTLSRSEIAFILRRPKRCPVRD